MDIAQPVPRSSFAHASEAELARILDFYQVRWRYEPDTFPIGWNLAGEVVESFSPDFYLPDFDLYVELTTLKQKLVRKKNRKLRRLRELYPDVQIKLFYAHDFRMLLLKFGRLALIGELSGTTGQATPPRVHVPVAADEVPLPAADGDEPDPVDAGPTPADGVPVLATATPRRASSPRGRRRGRRRRTADAATSVSAGLQAEAGETPGIA